VARSAVDDAVLVAGVGMGSLGWFTLLSVGLALLRRRVGEGGLRLADGLAGLGLLGFGGLLGWEALHRRG
jgi:hypothetical protein